MESTVAAIDEAARRSAAAWAEEGAELARVSHAAEMSTVMERARSEVVARAVEVTMTTAAAEVAVEAGPRSRDSFEGSEEDDVEDETSGEDSTDPEDPKQDWFVLFNVPQPAFSYP